MPDDETNEKKRGKQKFSSTYSERAIKKSPILKPTSGKLFRGFFSKFKNKRNPSRVTTWDSGNYFAMLPTPLGISRTGYGGSWGDQNARGYHATDPDQSTRMDNKVLKAFRTICNKEKKDDWIDIQELNLIDTFIGDILLVGIIAEQLFYQKIIPSSPEDEALGAGELKWDEDYINNAINRVVRDQYLVSPFSLNFLKTFCVFWKYDSSYEGKGMPGGYWVPNQLFKGITFAQWTELWQTLKGIKPSAELHAKRTGATLKALTEGDFDIFKEISIDSERCIFFQYTSMIHGKDGGGNSLAFQSIIGDSTFGGTAANWDGLKLPAKAEMDAPSDIWGLLSIFGIRNDGANNIYMVRTTPTAPTNNSKYGIVATGYNTKTAPGTERAFTTIFQYLREVPNILREVSLSHANGGAAVTDDAGIDDWTIALFGKDYHLISAPYSTASGIWDDLVETVYMGMFEKPILE